MNEILSNLPTYFIEGYYRWKKTRFVHEKTRYQNLARRQNPRAMLISCCDSRVEPSEVFDSKIGNLFAYRNIANLVPSHKSLTDSIAVFAALEYAVTKLKVANIIILGHSGCSGVSSYFQLRAKELENLPQDKNIQDKNITDKGCIPRWLENLRPAYDRACQHDANQHNASQHNASQHDANQHNASQHNNPDVDDQAKMSLLTRVERESIAVSLENLQEVEFIAKALAKKTLSLHGLWYDIGSGGLWFFDSKDWLPVIQN